MCPRTCRQELLKRVASHLERLLGSKVCDVPAATKKLAADEEASLRAAMVAQPEGVELEWDWSTKVLDAFLRPHDRRVSPLPPCRPLALPFSHKIALSTLPTPSGGRHPLGPSPRRRPFCRSLTPS